jgi:hypothetical protein
LQFRTRSIALKAKNAEFKPRNAALETAIFALRARTDRFRIKQARLERAEMAIAESRMRLLLLIAASL